MPIPNRNWGWTEDPALDPGFLESRFMPDENTPSDSCNSEHEER